jgi:hypothetical protein
MDHRRERMDMASNEHIETPTLQGVQDAGKAVAEAAATVAGDRVRIEVDARSNRAAVEVKAFALSMRASSASLREQGHDQQADVIDEVAARADKLALHLVKSDTDELVDDARRLAHQAIAYARREPALVIAGAFTLGLLIPKVVGSIAQDTNDTDTNTDIEEE